MAIKQKIEQKNKQKTDIKININLADKRKKRKQRRKKRIKFSQDENKRITNNDAQRNILFSQSTIIPRTHEQQNTGLILDKLRNQQQQIDKQNQLLNTGFNNLRLNSAISSVLEPVYSTPKRERKEEEEEEEEQPQENVYIKKTPGKEESKRGRKVNINEVSRKLYGNAKKENIEKTLKLIDDYFEDITLEDLKQQYRDEFDAEPNGRWGATQLIIALTGMKKTDEAISAGRVSTERNRGVGFGSPIFDTPERPRGLTEEPEPPTPLTELIGEVEN